MRIAKLIPIIVMGLLFVLYGCSKFYAFMPTPPMPAPAAEFIGALVKTGYLWYLVGVIEVIGGVCLFFARSRTIGALLLLPIVVNIVPYLWLLVQALPAFLMGGFLVGMEIWLLWSARHTLTRLYGGPFGGEKLDT